MSDREPALLRDANRNDRFRSAAEQAAPSSSEAALPGELMEPGALPPPAGPAPQASRPPPPPQPLARARRDAQAVYVIGFWRRLAAASIDLAVVLPAALIIAALAGWATGLHLPGNLHVFDVDLWIDLVLATDPALVMGLVLCCAIGLTYLLVFQIVVGRTLGMRALGI
ncbi:MAG TPA: RDD family protein, partial [Kofleriaceae bacterium]|nr:RDD family protein [Kofleriaceae bacterium]